VGNRLNRLVDAMLGDLADNRSVEAWAEVASIIPRT